MDGNQTFNLNQKCLQSVEHWGHTVHYNVCNGTSVVTEWGLVHYVFFPLMIFALVVFPLILWNKFKIAIKKRPLS